VQEGQPAAYSWFPGHMAKGLRQIEADLKVVDICLLVMDARIPRSSRHPQLETLMRTRNKPLVMVLNKADLAEPKATQRWMELLQSQGHFPVKVSVTGGQGVDRLYAIIREARELAVEKAHRTRRVAAAARLLVCGIPNVGKSSLINRLAPKGRAKTGKRPGITRGRQWITLPGDVEMLDSPGILFPRIEGWEMFMHLAVVGAIKEENLPLLDVSEKLAALLAERKVLDVGEPGEEGWLGTVARKRGMLLAGGVPDIERAAHYMLKATREGRWGPLTLERVEERDRAPEN